jgi:WD40 repeat protein
VSPTQQGVVFAVALSNNTESLKLYDVRSYDQGPFASWKVPSGEQLTFSTLKFSPDGARILLGTHNGVTFLLDAFGGQPVCQCAIKYQHRQTDRERECVCVLMRVCADN